MKVLFLSHRVPWPPDRGDRIRSARWIEALSAEHELHVGALGDVRRGVARPTGIREVRIARRPPRARALLSLLGGRSLTEGALRSGPLDRWVRATVAGCGADVVVGFSSGMAPYLMDLPVPRVLDMVDADSEKWRAYARWRRPRSLFGLEARRVRILEERVLAAFDRVTVVAEPEAAVFHGSHRPEVLGNGVDTDWFGGRDAGDGEGVVMTGVMDYPPNAEGAEWFVRHVLPLVRRDVPGARFTVVGASPTPRVRRLARLDGVEVTGRVEDVRPFLFRAAVAVAPMAMGTGVPNKILEAMASGRPVVATPRSVAGLPGVVAACVRTASEPPAFAAEVTRYLRDAGARLGAGEASRRAVASECRWEPVLARMREIVREVASTPARGYVPGAVVPPDNGPSGPFHGRARHGSQTP